MIFFRLSGTFSGPSHSDNRGLAELLFGSDTSLGPTVFPDDRKSISALLHVLYNCWPRRRANQRQKIMVRCPLVRRFKVGNVYTHLWEIATKEEVAGLCSSALEHERELVQLEMSSTLHDSFFFLRLFFGFFWTIFLAVSICHWNCGVLLQLLPSLYFVRSGKKFVWRA